MVSSGPAPSPQKRSLNSSLQPSPNRKSQVKGEGSVLVLKVVFNTHLRGRRHLLTTGSGGLPPFPRLDPPEDEERWPKKTPKNV